MAFDTSYDVIYQNLYTLTPGHPVLSGHYGIPRGSPLNHLCPESILLAKICQHIVFEILAKKIKRKLLSEKYRRNSKCRKNRKSKKNFSWYVKRLSNKYGKNSRNNKLLKILLLQREKAKKGFVKSANVAKIAKVTGIFLAKWKDWLTNVAEIARLTNLTKYYTLKEKRSRRASRSPEILNKSQK